MKAAPKARTSVSEAGVRHGRAPVRLLTIDQAGVALGFGSVRTAVDRIVRLDAVTENLTAAGRTAWGEFVGGTLERIEGIAAIFRFHDECLVVLQAVFTLDFLSLANSCAAIVPNYGHTDPVKTWANDYIDRNCITHGLDMATVAKQDFVETIEEVILKPRDMDYKINFPRQTCTYAEEAALKLVDWARRQASSRPCLSQYEQAFDCHARNAAVRNTAGVAEAHGAG